jgi:TetR/AcrR family transcriptional repressor of nem operon
MAMNDTRTRILDLAEDFTQRAGFNGFSYLDLAAEIGIKNSSIHYYFKAKADLGLALVTRIREAHSTSMAALDQQFEQPEQRLNAMIEYFKGYVRSNKICMCGMMAAEFESVSPEVRKALVLYFKDIQNWLTKQFSQMNHSDPQRSALQFLSALEGSLLLARLEGDLNVVDRSVETFVNG